MATSSLRACRPASVSGKALLKILDAMREHILYLYRGNVSIGVPLQRISAAVVCALHSGVSKNKSTTCARAICACLGATSVKIIRDAISSFAHLTAQSLRFCSPSSGNRKSHRTAFGMSERMRSHVRNVVGSI